MTGIVRSVTLHGTLVGDIWWPVVEAQMPVTVDLTREARRYVNATGSGLVDAVKAAVDGAGDFQSARLTADSYIRVQHVWHVPYAVNRRVTFERVVDVTSLPSLADYVAANVPSDGPEP